MSVDPTAAGSAKPVDGDEERLWADPRLGEAIALFNQGEWYACHDGFEELWHETQGPSRALLQGLLQVAVSQLHLERGNRHGATVLLGEGLGRLDRCGHQDLGVELGPLREGLRRWLQALQNGEDTTVLARPCLQWSPPPPR